MRYCSYLPLSFIAAYKSRRDCVCLDDNFRVNEEIVRRDHRFLEDDALEALFRCVCVVSM